MHISCIFYHLVLIAFVIRASPVGTHLPVLVCYFLRLDLPLSHSMHHLVLGINFILTKI